jgi:hypothetical protein
MDDDLFEMPSKVDIRRLKIGGEIPVILVDGIFKNPDQIREYALRLPYSQPPYPYPGRRAAIPEPNRSLADLKRKILSLVNSQYLSQLPIAQDGQRLLAFRKLHTDFGVVDVHPDELSSEQRLPHTDPVPVFGLIYLNREERGGTLFFKQRQSIDDEERRGGYLITSNPAFELLGRIEPAYNRLAIYPGFVPHTGEIAGDWIRGPDRFSNPRLTQRLVFLP